MKICCSCQKELPLDQFGKHKNRKDGFQSICKSCQHDYKIQHYQKNRKRYIKQQKEWAVAFRQWYIDYKSQFKCVRCPENHPACIQFHHIKDDKIDNVAALFRTGSKNKIIDEIKKCIPLCANCHAKEHYGVMV